jgi:hypothetical protein
VTISTDYVPPSRARLTGVWHRYLTVFLTLRSPNCTARLTHRLRRGDELMPWFDT